MSNSCFTVTEYRSPCSFIRQFPHSVHCDSAELQLAVKEYRPRNQPQPDKDSVTIIAAHGNGFPKECYEPFWEELLKASADAGHTFKIRAIWIADVAHQGESYALNADKLGDDPNWVDHSRDLLLMINHFRQLMQPPFVGFGHSMGALQIINLALLHPRLFHSLIVVEPILQDAPPPGPNAAMFSSIRRETWDTRAAAEKQISKSPFFQSMDTRVVEKYLQFGLQDIAGGRVKLATPKPQEAWSYIRPNFQSLPEKLGPEARNHERMLNPEYSPFSHHSTAVWTRPECVLTIQALPNLRPRALFLYGDYSYINFDEIREKHTKATGTGHGGNGGKADGGVEERVLEDVGHLCCFEQPGAVARTCLEWLDVEITRWKYEQNFWATLETEKSKNGRTELSDKWLAEVKKDADIQRPAKAAAKL